MKDRHNANTRSHGLVGEDLMNAKPVSLDFLWRLGLIALAALLIGTVSVAYAEDGHPQPATPTPTPWCPKDYAYSEDAGKCVYIAVVDCGPSPYNFNDVGGFWERPFNKWCFEHTDDAFESFFHGLTWPEAQDRLNALGLGGLAKDAQVAALFAGGYWNPITEVEPEPLECPEGKDWNPLEQRCEVIEPPDCGPNPYVFNALGGHWERRFNNLCFEHRDDPFEVFFHQMTWGEAEAFLSGNSLSSLARHEQVSALVSLGYVDADGAFIPVALRPTQGTPSTITPGPGGTYVVQPGDWLYKIARAHGVSVTDLIRLNSATYPTLLTQPGVIRVGWVFKLP
jgi:hypothetical protein